MTSTERQSEASASDVVERTNREPDQVLRRALERGEGSTSVWELQLPWAVRLRLAAAGFSALDDVVAAAAEGPRHSWETRDLVEVSLRLVVRSLEAQPGETASDKGGTPIGQLQLSTRPRNALLSAGFRTVEEVVQRTPDELLAAPNLGSGSLKEIVKALDRVGLRLARSGERASAERLAPLDLQISGDDQRQQMLAMRRAQATLAQIGEAFGMTREKVCQILGEDVSAGRAPMPSPLSRQERGLARKEEMIAMRRSGATLDEIGKAFDVTRERVRQILGKSVAMGEVSRARTEAAMAAALKHEPQILNAYRRGDEIDTISQEIGLAPSLVETVIRAAASTSDRARRNKNRAEARSSQTYSDLDLIEAIRTVEDHLGRTPSSLDYRKAAGEFGLPSLPTIGNRFGSWSQAVQAAGIRPLAPNRRNYSRRWTPDACWLAVSLLTFELGEPPTAQAYDLLAQGDDDLPSLATVRNRLGRWSALVARLADLPAASDILTKLEITEASSEQAQEVIWCAYLADELTDDELRCLLASGSFRWDASFGEIPPELNGYAKPHSEGDMAA